MVSKAQHDIRRKRQVLDYAAQHGNVRKTCRHFGIPRSLFYLWRGAHTREGDAGLVNKRPCARSHPNATPPAVVELILHLRRTYHLGPIRIVWYLERYHGIAVCDATVYRTLRRHGLHRLPTRVGRRAVHTHRYEKPVPGHHVQVDVKFLTLQGPAGRHIRRSQYRPSMTPRGSARCASTADTRSRTPSRSSITSWGSFRSGRTDPGMSSRPCFTGIWPTRESSPFLSTVAYAASLFAVVVSIFSSRFISARSFGRWRYPATCSRGSMSSAVHADPRRCASTADTRSRTPSRSSITSWRKFPFRIHTIRTDRGHEFQALFHWHLADQGIRHVYIKPRTPQLNGKVERSHRTDQQEFYQLLSYKGDVDLEQRLTEWEHFYNYHRPHGAFAGGTPYEALRERLQS